MEIPWHRKCHSDVTESNMHFKRRARFFFQIGGGGILLLKLELTKLFGVNHGTLTARGKWTRELKVQGLYDQFKGNVGLPTKLTAATHPSSSQLTR